MRCEGLVVRVRDSLRTIDLAREVGISVQQVRNLEAGGYLPPVERSPSGYRRYTAQHLAALTVSRRMIVGYGWQRTQQIMRAAHEGRLADALALIDQRHAELDGTRRHLDQTLEALGVIATQLPADAPGRGARRVRVGVAARLVGVRVSALRFWEQQGLLRPVREAESRYRLYDESQLRRLRVVVLLRQAHADFDVIRTTLDELEAGQPQRALAAVERRRGELAAASWRCLQAVATFQAYAGAYLPDAVPRSEGPAPPVPPG